jgi:hypothetical protein
LDKIRFVQIIEVEGGDRSCRTSFYPSNQDILDTMAERLTPPAYIVRWILFPNRIVPAQYAWANPTLIPGDPTPAAFQRMLWPQWLELIEREKAIGTGHVGPIT